MRSSFIFLFLVAFTFFWACKEQEIPVLETGSMKAMPAEWIDKDTDHKIIRLTGPEGDSRSFYFHNNPFIPGGRGKAGQMIYYGQVPKGTDDKDFTPRGSQHLFSMNIKTRESTQITNHPGRISGEIVGRKTNKVYYQCHDSVFSTNIESLESELVFVFPDSIRAGITTLNADETLLAGVSSNKAKSEILRQFPRKGDFFTRIYEAKLRHTLFTIDIESGEINKFFSDTAWLNHVQFSPTDPELLMFCHEGPWHLLDRIWTININDPAPKLMHKRTVYREIAGHEFFSHDGKTIWFDLQIPRGENFYLAGLDMETMAEKRYGLTRDEWSIHFNQDPSMRLFAGDGGDPGQVARASDGMWLYLFWPEGDSLRSEKLVNMKAHDYDLEPNVHFSPDGKLVIFRANFEGSSQIYAVEVAKTLIKGRKSKE